MLLNLSSDYHIIAESPLTAAYIAAGSQSQVTAVNVSTPTVAAHRRFLPLLAQARRIGSFLFLAKILVLFLSFLPLSFLLHSAPRALRRAASCVRLSRAAPRAYSLCCPLRSCAARNRSARETRARGAARSCALYSPATGAGSPTTDDMHSAGAAPPVLLPTRTLLSPRRSESPRHATRSRQPARPRLASAARPRIAPPAFPARQRIAPSRRPPAHRAFNCVIAVHRRRRSHPQLAAAPLWRLRPGSPPPARPPPPCAC